MTRCVRRVGRLVFGGCDEFCHNFLKGMYLTLNLIFIIYNRIEDKTERGLTTPRPALERLQQQQQK